LQFVGCEKAENRLVQQMWVLKKLLSAAPHVIHAGG